MGLDTGCCYITIIFFASGSLLLMSHRHTWPTTAATRWPRVHTYRLFEPCPFLRWANNLHIDLKKQLNQSSIQNTSQRPMFSFQQVRFQMKLCNPLTYLHVGKCFPCALVQMATVTCWTDLIPHMAGFPIIKVGTLSWTKRCMCQASKERTRLFSTHVLAAVQFPIWYQQ